jgi:hypothetical protein
VPKGPWVTGARAFLWTTADEHGAVPQAACVDRSAFPRRGLHGVFLGSHAVAEGAVTAKQLKADLYRRLLRDVYADPGIPLSHELLARGAALLLPEAAVLAGRSAAAWFGAPFASVNDPVLVLVPPSSAWRGPRGVQVHRSAVGRHEVLTLEDGDIRLTSPVRTAWDIASLETVSNAVALLDGMVRAGHLDLERCRQVHARAHGRWRRRRVGPVLALVDGRSESPPESWVRVACARAGLPAPVPQFVVLADGEFLGRVDLAWPEYRLIVEYEGAYHFDGLQIRQDDRRYERLVAAGWRVIRLSAIDLRDMTAVVDRIARALRPTVLAESGLSAPRVPSGGGGGGPRGAAPPPPAPAAPSGSGWAPVEGARPGTT